MKKIVFSVFAFCLVLFFSCPPKRVVMELDKTLNYTIWLEKTDSSHVFKVELRFFGDHDGTTKLYTPNEWGPATGLRGNIKDLSVVNAKIKEQNDSHIVIEHAAHELLMVWYTVTSVSEYPLKDHNLAYHPIIKDEFFQFFGNGLFVYPEDLNDGGRPVNLNWEKFPEGWVIHNSYSSNQRKQSFSWKDSLWLEAIYVGGDYRIHEIKIEGDPVYVAMRGENWNFTDEAYQTLLKKVITQQRYFWNDYDFDYFTVTLSPYMEGSRGMSYQGTGLRNAFALNATENVQLKDFEYLFSHELMHEWIGLQIKTADPEAFRYWFSEGFTDYFTYINMRECGLLDQQGYINAMNEVVKKYYLSPVRNATNDELAANFFSDYNNYGKLAYNRGCLFATYVDWKIRKCSKGKHSLKNVMQDFLKTCKSGENRLSDELFIKTVNKYLKKSIKPDFEKHIQNGELILLEDWMLGTENIVKNESLEVFDLGFDEKASIDAKKIIGLKENSNAYKAGLRNGQVMQGHGYYYGRPDIKAEIYVEVDRKEKKVTFYPVGQSKEAIPQFVIK